VQSTAEGTPASREQIHTLIDLACQGIDELFALQTTALDGL
jgi:ribonuclease PH